MDFAVCILLWVIAGFLSPLRPLALAAAKPSIIRDLMISLSNSAKAAIFQPCFQPCFESRNRKTPDFSRVFLSIYGMVEMGGI
jgi:hypothetical protein